jgi:hypothetical protein
VVPSTEELQRLQMDLKSFRDKATRLNLQVPAAFLCTKIRLAIATIRIPANMGALAQYRSQESSNCVGIIMALLDYLPGSPEMQCFQHS